MNKKTLAITSATLILPMICGIILWNRLPAEIATHFDINGEPNGYSSKIFTVFVLPLILLAIHLLGAFALRSDPQKRNISKRLSEIVFWICPVISLIVFYAIYGSALGYKFDIRFFAAYDALLLIIIGNYMPKCRQNRTVGIRVPWTLNDEDNWNRTHRFAGRFWVIFGFLIMINCVFDIFDPYISIILILVSVFVPVIYSGILHFNRQVQDK